MTGLSVLLLADDEPRIHANTTLDHIAALKRSRHRVQVFNPRGLVRAPGLSLAPFDAVIIHYSIALKGNHYLAPWFRERIAAFDGLKVQFVQDEYRWIDEITDAMRALGIDVIFTLLDRPEADRVYGPRVPDARTVHTLAGYIPDRLTRISVTDLADRPVAVGYRGRQTPFWLGQLGQEKVRIAQGFLEHARDSGLVLDIGWREDERIYGPAWDAFVGSCRTMLGTESGASIADWDGSLQRAVDEYLAEKPDASFEEVWHALLAPHEGNLEIRTISPRAFESIANGTALVQFPGSYSGILRPWEHFVPLEHDFSNLDEVVGKISDLPYLRELAGRTRAEIVGSGRFADATLTRELDELLDTHARPRHGRVGVPLAAAGASGRLDLRRRRLASEAVLLRTLAAARLSRLSPSVGFGLRGSRAWSNLRLGACLLAFSRLCSSQAELRRLLGACVRSSDLRSSLRVGRGGFGDLLRLGVLMESASSPERAGFRVSSSLDDDGLLRFTSRPLPDHPDASPDRELPENVHVQRVVWSHSAVGDAFSCPLVGSRRLWFQVGREQPAIYEFTVLPRLLARQPSLADALLVPTKQ